MFSETMRSVHVPEERRVPVPSMAPGARMPPAYVEEIQDDEPCHDEEETAEAEEDEESEEKEPVAKRVPGHLCECSMLQVSVIDIDIDMT